jgi:FkbM family methyltransferase
MLTGRGALLVRQARAYGLHSAASAAWAFARRQFCAQAMRITSAVGLSPTRFARSIWNDQSGDMPGHEAFAALDDIFARSRRRNIDLSILVPDHLLPVFRYLSGLMTRRSRVIACADALAGREPTVDMALIGRTTVGPLASWLLQHGGSFRSVLENSGYVILVRSGSAAASLFPNSDRTAWDAIPDLGAFAQERIESHGVVFSVRPFTADHLILAETWDGYMAWLAEAGITEARTVLDLGAHIGGFSLHLARARSPAAIYAVEANPDNFRLLQQNVVANHAGHIITPMHGAAGDRDGRATLVLSSDNTGGHKIAVLPNGVAAVQVPIIDVAALVDRIGPVDLLKIDVEGSEIPILRRLGPRLRQIRTIIGELHGSPFGTPRDAVAIMQQVGFSVALRGDPAMPLLLATRA